MNLVAGGFCSRACALWFVRSSVWVHQPAWWGAGLALGSATAEVSSFLKSGLE